jgi:nitrile hydratase accessory protein
MPSSPISNPPEQPAPPVFAEPWQAQAFALQVALMERGLFTPREWAETLGATIRAAQAAGDADTGETYWRHWALALETILAAKGLTSPVVIEARMGTLAGKAAGEHLATGEAAPLPSSGPSGHLLP